MRDRWLNDLVETVFGLVPPWTWMLLVGLLLVLVVIHRRRTSRREDEMRELIRQGKSAVSVAAKKRSISPQMHGHYGEFSTKPGDDDAWKPHG